MATTFEIIDKTTLGSTAAYIEFTSIPSTYTDIFVYASIRSNRSALNDEASIQLNGTTVTGKRIYGDGAGVGTDNSADLIPPSANSTANTFSNISIYVPNYASTTTYKSVSTDGVGENNGTYNYNSLSAGIYSSNTAVSSLRITCANGSFVANSSVYLYGIKNS